MLICLAHAAYSFGLFVAPRTITLVSSPDVRPSHNLCSQAEDHALALNTMQGNTHVINSAFIIPVTSWSLLLLLLNKESISSMKICVASRFSASSRSLHSLLHTILGCSFFARENNPATSLFDSPNHLFVLVDSLTSAFVRAPRVGRLTSWTRAS
jgi:hypothetical protein